MKEKMPWLKTRLHEQGRTPTALAKHLGIAAPRVYEMIAGRRHIQSNEVAPMAEFLGWSLDEINRHLPEHSRWSPVIPAGTDIFAKAAQNLVRFQAKQVCDMIDAAPKVVDVDEVRTTVLTYITTHFAGRPISVETIERGLALACFEMKQAAMAKPLPNA